jgi:hypothetical protein
VLDGDDDGGNDRSRRYGKDGKDGGVVIKIESKVCASESCIFGSGSDGVPIYSMSMRDQRKWAHAYLDLWDNTNWNWQRQVVLGNILDGLNTGNYRQMTMMEAMVNR